MRPELEYYIVIPAHNEEAFLEQTLHSILGQSLMPKKIVVVNDHSTDGTEQVIDRFSAKNTSITKVNATSSTSHMPGSKVINAFNMGLSVLDEDYDFLVKLDADVILPEHYFEKIGLIFNTHHKVGIAGGFIFEQDSDGEWKRNHPMDNDHIRGAFKAYSKACFRAIGGLRAAIGWDTVDELLARYHGFELYADPGLKVKHLRPTGKAYSAKAKLLQGRAMYTMRYGFLVSLIASLKMMWKLRKPVLLFDNMKGYFDAKKQKVTFIVSMEEGRFIRKLRWKNIKRKLLKVNS